MSDFRSAPGRNPLWRATDGRFSNFEFVDTEFRSDSILRRILSIARKLGYRGMLEEEILEEECALLAAENAALRIRLKKFQRSYVVRLSFFEGSDQSAPGEFLGYAIVKRDRLLKGSFTHVYESVLKAPRDHRHNNFCHCHKGFRVCTTIGEFTVQGVLFAQQNDATFVCAHVALRTLISCVLPGVDPSYAQINQWAGVDHADPAKNVGGRELSSGREGGLDPTQIENVLLGAGLVPELIVHQPNTPAELPPDVEFQRLLYGYLESGRPVLLGFELGADPVNKGDGCHIIPVFGHTFNEDLWAPEAERAYFGHDRKYFPSESWLSAYVAHDDNFGPYVCLPRHYLNRSQFRLLVGLKPHPTTITATEAEAAALDFANYFSGLVSQTGLDWLERQFAFTRAELLVLRPILTSRKEYLGQLRLWKDREGLDLEPDMGDLIEKTIPEVFWMVEVSAPELYPGSRRKFGEILVQADPAQGTPASVLMMRAPSLVVLHETTGFSIHRTRLAGHTDLFRLS